ncbi:hypothetical protein [Anaerovorax odorimutans]|uniref:hypothetical protein n=1 Tax=Anaerovorax odorimutans TaxID=109327 RepID=UPI00040F737A|nr:hypothetical protein [Anaerovorax odorimutans]
MLNTKENENNNNEFRKTIGLSCAICGSLDANIPFKDHFICKDCLYYIKTLINR